MDDRRRTYCRHWSVIDLRCKAGRPCDSNTPYTCSEYGDVLDALRRTPAAQPRQDPPAPAKRPSSVLCPECGQKLEYRDGCAVCAGGHSWKLRRGRRHCPVCGEKYSTFGLPQPGHEQLYRNVYQMCTCGWAHLDVRYVGPAEPRGYGGQRWSPRTGRLLVHRSRLTGELYR
ncbi:MAG: hypothetical protein WC869_10520 [Phycisphaerae bacterium]|jgi:hypothetical protein